MYSRQSFSHPSLFPSNDPTPRRRLVLLPSRSRQPIEPAPLLLRLLLILTRLERGLSSIWARRDVRRSLVLRVIGRGSCWQVLLLISMVGIDVGCLLASETSKRNRHKEGGQAKGDATRRDEGRWKQEETSSRREDARGGTTRTHARNSSSK